MPVLEDLQQIDALVGGKHGQAPVIEDQQIDAAEGLEQPGVAAVAVDHRAYLDRESHERVLDATLRDAGVEVLALAGYMRILTPLLVEAWAGRMLNIHPSLLPLFPGLDTHERALQAGMKLHGCTVHEVVLGVDEGPILGQAAVPVLPGDTAQTLAARVLTQEHLMYPRVVERLIAG